MIQKKQRNGQLRQFCHSILMNGGAWGICAPPPRPPPRIALFFLSLCPDAAGDFFSFVTRMPQVRFDCFLCFSFVFCLVFLFLSLCPDVAGDLFLVCYPDAAGAFFVRFKAPCNTSIYFFKVFFMGKNGIVFDPPTCPLEWVT